MQYDPDALRRYLDGRDVPCPNCGYNLRGLAADRCPECNQALELGVRLAEPDAGALFVTLGAAWTMGGAGTVYLAVVLLLSWHFDDLPPGAVFPIPAIGAVLGTAAAALLGRRRGRMWFRSRSRGARRAMVVGSWSAVGVLIVAYTAHLIVAVF